jgi:hypothetical protein
MFVVRWIHMVPQRDIFTLSDSSVDFAVNERSFVCMYVGKC